MVVNFSANLLVNKVISIQKHTNNNTVSIKSQPAFQGNLLNDYLQNQADINIATVNVQKNSKIKPYQNDLRKLFSTNSAKILCLNTRVATAQDKNGNEYIDPNEKPGTFLGLVNRLDEIKKEGFNTIHLLPINPPGKDNAFGTAGSVYSPEDLLKIDPVLIEKNDSRTDKEQFKAFVDECHNRGIRVMIDMPSCASYSLYKNRPDLMAIENGIAQTPGGWEDIRMFQPWDDRGKRTLNPKLLEYHRQFLDMLIDAGVDGIRADVARAKPVEFWDILIPYSRKRNPEFAWLAESYTYEDASPQANMPYDRPEDSLRAGFDAYYGQYHIFHEWPRAKDLHDYVIDNLNMSYRVDNGKSLIGSFATHDDVSPMFHGGTDYCNLTSGLQATLPMMNPYFVDGFQSGDYYLYKYGNSQNPVTQTDSHEMKVHEGKMDIFNLSRRPQGKNPEIGEFMTACLNFRDKYADITKRGSYIILNKEKDKQDQVIAFARHRQGRTLLVLANKDVNHPVACNVKVPTLKENQKLENLLPKYGHESKFQVNEGSVSTVLGPGRIHVFEIETPYIEMYSDKVYKQH